MVTRFARIRDWVLDWLAPGDCMGCGVELTDGRAWCGSCAQRLESNHVVELNGAALFAPYRHDGALRDAIHRLKYQNRPEYARRLVASGFRECEPLAFVGAILVPVPLHPLRLVERGYNQSALLARALGFRWNLPVRFDLLRRTVSTEFQVGRDRLARAANVRGAFSVRTTACPRRAVWLVDDVVTTGATAASCRAVLESAGFDVLGTVALAHAQTPVRPNRAIEEA